MKIIQIEKFGNSEVLKLKDIKLVDPNSDEVQIKHVAIGLNYIDTYHRSGLGFSKDISLTSKTSGPPVLLISTAFIIYFTNVPLW